MANRPIKFEKVSFEQFKESCSNNPFLTKKGDAEIREAYEKIQLPQRGTSGSAGYDFTTPFEASVSRNPILIPTGIRCKMANNVVLMIVPRSGLGFKYNMELSNTIGIIDSDYYNSTNEGHIIAKIKSDTAFLLNAGDRFVQGILIPYFITVDDNVKTERDGGFGSTGN